VRNAFAATSGDVVFGDRGNRCRGVRPADGVAGLDLRRPHPGDRVERGVAVTVTSNGFRLSPLNGDVRALVSG
jgi:hypothetical protein